ncbi:MAG: sensor domain-containing diguanylate cyclase [Gammaproteobacteria bacterium]|nr:sensor domain-containing diguanylate cyclase [Gammaproteobacteria bacterium]
MQLRDPAIPGSPGHMVRQPSDNAAAPFREAFERSPSMQLFIDVASARVVEANAAMIAFLGCSADRLRRLRLAELLIAPRDESDSVAAGLLDGDTNRVTVRMRDGEGSLRHAELHAAPLTGTNGAPLLHVVVQDVSARVNAESRLQVYSEFYENLPVPLYRATRGATGRFIRFNPAFLRLFEAERPEQLFDRNISDFYVDPRERERFSNELMQNDEVHRYELQLRTLSGRVIQCIDTAYQHEDENGQVVFDGALEDVTRQRELEQELAYQARYDQLTGLANRRYGETQLASELQRCERYGQSFSLLMLDLDHFKRVNDERGHAAGDILLERVAEVIGHHVRQTDVAARWGGEEFIVLLPSTSETGAARLAEKLREAIGKVSHDDGSGVTVSVGYGQYARGEGRDAFLARLDQALYAAKEAGRDRVCLAPLPSKGNGHREAGR